MPEQVHVAKDKVELFILSTMANRHGMVAGATGTGKTVTIQVIAERFSAVGVPVFIADVKGDVSGISQPGGNPKVMDRVKQLGVDGYTPRGYPVTFWDVFGEQGHPLRATVSDMGPLLLGRLLDLNDTQTGVLNLVFKIADDNGLLLLDLKDLRMMLQYVGDNAKQFTTEYGTVSSASVGAIQRGLLALESQGADQFFGEPTLDIRDLMRTDSHGYGMVNLLAADKLMQSPKVYATFLLWLLAELFENLPEVGDPDKPKLVFFFDEAHLLFNEAPKALLEKIEQVVRLIRSKGVGVFFISQNPLDVPDMVLGQLGNRVQHALRAYTARDQKAVKAAAGTFRLNPALDLESVITELGTGEALVSFLDEKGRPNVVERAFVLPPQSQIGPITPDQRAAILAASTIGNRYNQVIDRESAYELLKVRADEATAAAAAEAAAKDQAAADKQAAKEAAQRQKEFEKAQAAAMKAERSASRSQPADPMNTMLNELGKTMGREMGKSIQRGLFGSLFGRK
ncbi:MAG: DUF853 family protein [Anaerolineae bacterium]|nr:DUF853 family protein [Anaerolineae bacterium]